MNFGHILFSRFLLIIFSHAITFFNIFSSLLFWTPTLFDSVVHFNTFKRLIRVNMCFVQFMLLSILNFCNFLSHLRFLLDLKNTFLYMIYSEFHILVYPSFEFTISLNNHTRFQTIPFIYIGIKQAK